MNAFALKQANTTKWHEGKDFRASVLIKPLFSPWSLIFNQRFCENNSPSYDRRDSEIRWLSSFDQSFMSALHMTRCYYDRVFMRVENIVDDLAQ